MKKQLLAPALVVLFTAAPAFALTVSANANVNAGTTGVSANVSARVTTAKDRADKEIDRRVSLLTDLNTKVQAMVKVSADEKASVTADISNEISTLTALKAKIDGETDITVLKPDIQSITKSYRVFALIIPRTRIVVAADKLDTVVDALTALGAKLSTRVDAAKANGSDTTALEASLTDLNAKLADAKVQADAAVSHVASLTPDNGDKTQQQTNGTALQQSRADLRVGLKDVQDARKDVGSVITGLKSLNVSTTASTSAQVSQ